MQSVNKVILLGRLGQDMALGYTAAGSPIGKLRLATSRRWKNAAGEMQEYTTWHNLVWYSKQAETLRMKLKKGAPVFVEGEIDNREYEKKDGSKGYVSEVKVSNLQLLDPSSEKKDPSEFGESVSQSLATELRKPIQTAFNEEDIPF